MKNASIEHADVAITVFNGTEPERKVLSFDDEQLVRDFRVISVLGEGTAGVTYKVIDTGLEVERVLKMLRPGMPDYFKWKYETEAKIAARVEHPNFMNIADYGKWKGIPWMLTDYLHSGSLRAHIDTCIRFHPAVCIAIMIEIINGLAFVYNKTFTISGVTMSNLVHRNLRPENIFLPLVSTTLKVADYGMVRPANEHMFAIQNSREYMSPEQYESGDVDCSSTIYSSGILLYEMLCGFRPFKDSIDQSITAKQNGIYEPVTKFRPEVHNAVCAIVDTCLQPSPGNRYERYESVLEELHNALAAMSPCLPEEIVCEFSKNPENYTPQLHTGFRNTNKTLSETVTTQKKPFLRTMFISACALLLLTAAIVSGLFILKKRNTTPLQPHTLASNNTVDTTVRPPDTTLNVSDTVAEPAAIPGGNAEKKPASNPVTPSTPLKTPARAVVRKQKPSLLNPALLALKKQAYSTVIAEVNKLDLTNLPKSTLDSAVILMAESYYNSGNMAEVTALGNKFGIDDALFHKLSALAYKQLNDYENAVQAIDKALAAPARTGNVTKNSLLYERASIHLFAYMRKPNRTNKMKANEAYRRYLDEACSGKTSETCEEATRIMKRHFGQVKAH